MPELPEVPFAWRLLALLLVLGSVAGVERWRRGPEATRWREYAGLLAAGALGAAFGAAFDQLSCTLSPDYFELGKGLEPGPGFRLRVTALGAQAGFGAGLLGGGALLVVGRPGRGPVVPLRLLARQVPWVPAGALALAPLGALLWPRVAPDLDLGLRPSPTAAFRTVWGLHVGLYAGAALGLGVALWRARRTRLSLGAAATPPAWASAPGAGPPPGAGAPPEPADPGGSGP